MTARGQRNKTKILSLDPGKTTGWVIGLGPELVEAGQVDGSKIGNMVWDALTSNYILGVVVEYFDLRSFTTDAFDTVKLIGQIEYIAGVKATPLRFVTAASKKKFRMAPTVMQVLKDKGPHAADAEMIRLWDLNYGQW